MRDFPSSSIPRGWYIIGWSSDFVSGETVPLHYFEQDLVAYRGASGTVRVFDAYCRHMGAHLGHGGEVEGDCIRCPYHGWRFNEDGYNDDIPYGNTRPMANLRVRPWVTQEFDDLVFVYYSPDGREPTESLPERFNRLDGPTWPADERARKIWLDVPMSPQFAAENSADAAHFKFVHQAGDVANMVKFEHDESHFFERFELTFGADEQTTWATPTGPLPGVILGESWGLGVLYAKLEAFDDVIYVLGMTPISANRVDLRSTTWVRTKRGDGSDLDARTRDRWVAQQNAQVDADLRIWKHQTYIQKPPFATVERSSLRAFRAWASQFYETG